MDTEDEHFPPFQGKEGPGAEYRNPNEATGAELIDCITVCAFEKASNVLCRLQQALPEVEWLRLLHWDREEAFFSGRVEGYHIMMAMARLASKISGNVEDALRYVWEAQSADPIIKYSDLY